MSLALNYTGRHHVTLHTAFIPNVAVTMMGIKAYLVYTFGNLVLCRVNTSHVSNVAVT